LSDLLSFVIVEIWSVLSVFLADLKVAALNFSGFCAAGVSVGTYFLFNDLFGAVHTLNRVADAAIDLTWRP